MRLPARTSQQGKTEEARQFHEAIWACHQRGERLLVVPPDGQTAGAYLVRQSGCLHRFWTTRGYALHMAQTPDKAAVEVWVTPVPVTTTFAA